MRLSVSEHDCRAFTGGWSICAKAMMGALNAVEYDGRLRILELGSGAGTMAMLSLLDKLAVPFEYGAYENDPRYICQDSRVETVQWDGRQFPDEIEGKYDLIIIDGPNGVTRCKWYPLLRSCVQNGTILLIDDYDHHPEFSQSLNANFVYEVLDRQSGQHECWKTVRVQQERQL